MKRFIAALSSLLIMPAFAEVAPVYYFEDAIEYSDDFIDEDIVLDEVEEVITPTAAVVPATASPRTTTSRSASRIVPSSVSASNTANRGTARRAVSSRTTAGSTASRGAAAGNTTASRTTGTATRSGNVSSRRVAQATPANTARAASTGSLTQTDTVSSPLYTGRVGVRPAATSSIGTRTPSAVTRIATTASVSNTATVDSAATVASMDELAQMTDYCKAQYTQCMDSFCNVLDDNQGRCSCSANLKNYSKTEDALKKATEELQDVAQKIQYIGLTKDEIQTLFSTTEAELEMQTTTDSTRLKSDLDRVKNMIIDVKSGTATASDTSMSLDLSGLLDFSFGNSGFDLASLFGTSTSTSNISNQRGAELYKTAASRCKTAVLNTCQQQGVDIGILTNAYDLEIDKQCLLYERSLDDANTNMTATVRNAKSVLQKARLLVAQQKNAYDLRGCVNALDSCMQDDFVCGSDYENCLDPTGKYVVNGSIIVGSTPGVSGGNITSSTTAASDLYSSWNYGSSQTAWGNGTISAFITAEITTGTAQPPVNPTNMVEYLQGKIGYTTNDGKSLGMCISVLNKCQDYTYISSGKTYTGDNSVVINYMERTLIQIKTQQDEVLARYAESCMTDVASCLSSNNYGTSSATATQACAAQITTCESVIYGTTSVNKDKIIAAAGGGYVCPANSFLNPTKTAAAAGAPTTTAVVASTPTGAFCECIKKGALVSGACPE
ncbi:MAG: hypothetical protein LBF37_00555 [Rickettsiales bacterium]|nr:hypothetical protein [Rickettsiales bacterium]